MAPPLRVAPGQTVDGRFLILEEIGRGGMSVVFKARDLADHGGLVAVKVPLPQYAGGMGSWSFFQHEVEIGLRLRHPYVLRFVPPGANPRGLVVTEFVSGTTLADRIGKGDPMREAEALSVASRLCEAVAYLHGQSVVHYDLKPGNVMLCDDGTLR
ncbi:MAG TPA: protein kinase, partial [Polyangiaceae bacterium]|nr:protein kinase [Polyangiaceae bacterium]